MQLQARVTNMVAAQSAAAAAAEAESQPTLVPTPVPAAKGAGTDGAPGNEDGASDTEVRAALEAAREQVASLQASSARIPRLVQALHDTQEQRDELQVRHHGIVCIVAPPLMWTRAPARGTMGGGGALRCASASPVNNTNPRTVRVITAHRCGAARAHRAA